MTYHMTIRMHTWPKKVESHGYSCSFMDLQWPLARFFGHRVQGARCARFDAGARQPDVGGGIYDDWWRQLDPGHEPASRARRIRRSTRSHAVQGVQPQRARYCIYSSDIVVALNPVLIHDTTACPTGCQTGLTTGCIV